MTKGRSFRQFAADDLSTTAHDWTAHLTGERRLAASTLDAYHRDLAQFFAFLTGHLGGLPSLADFTALKPVDVRSFLASRRRNGIGARTLGRQLAALREFARYLNRNKIAATTAFQVVRPPKQQRTLPRALSVSDALRLVGSSDLARENWIAARDRAVLTLLYGCGLRIAEALAVRAGDAPIAGRDGLRVFGKGGKTRIVPVLPIVSDAISHYIDLCPYPLLPSGSLFRGARGGSVSPAIVQKAVRQLRSDLGLDDRTTPHSLRHSFATHLIGCGGDLRTVQELLGHASLSTTQNYTKMDIARILEVYSATHPRVCRP